MTGQVALARPSMVRRVRRVHLFTTLAVAALAMLSVPASAAAQAVYGSLSGTVTDSSGGALPGATVSIRSLERNVVDAVVANDSGNYAKDRLLPGAYEVKAELTGFKTAVVERVTVSVDTQTPVNFKLEVGSMTEAVTVSGGAPLLKTDRADVATRFDAKELTELPVLDRNFTKFILLTPGAQQMGWQHAASENPQGSTQTQINGQHFSGTGYQLDGTENRDPILGIIVVNPNLESIGESKITSQNYDAEFGQATAGVVSVQTKSGTNQIHGSAFEFFQNAALQARNPFRQARVDPLTGKFIPDTKKNQFGGSAGGPILQDRWFFFGDYQGTRQNQGGSRLLSVPTAQARAGNFSEYGQAIYDPATGAAFPNATIPAARQSPQARALLDLIPLPNAPGTENGTRDNYTASGVETFTQNSFNTRIDGRLSDKMNTFGRYSVGKFSRDGTGALGIAGGPALVGIAGGLGVAQSEPRLRHRRRRVLVAAGRLPLRLVPVQGRRAAGRLRHDPGGRCRHPQSEQRHDLHQRLALALHARQPGRHELGLRPRGQRLQLPARAEREAVAGGRQRHQDLGQSHQQGGHRRAPRLQPPRALRSASLRRADVQRVADEQRRSRWPRPGLVPAR